MEFSVHSLGSGSSGNSMLVLAGGTKILLDAGVPVLQLQKRLAKFRLTLSDIDALFLTHEHGDHSRSAYSLSKRFGVPMYANSATLSALARGGAPANWWAIDTGASRSIGSTCVESFPISHDAVEPVGYNIYHKGYKVSFVTDTGVAGDEILRRIDGADLTILEANHDVERLMRSSYPESLKERILGDSGHLSNEAAADLLIRHIKKASCVWLAHLSESNNSPRFARRYVQRRLTEVGCTNVVLDVALRDTASLTWRPGAKSVQMELSLS